MSLPSRRALRERAAGVRQHARRRGGGTRGPALRAGTVITIRLLEAPEADGALAELVELSGAGWPQGASLVAEVDGAARAALAVAGGEPLADPFHPSAELVSLLALRRAQLEAETRDGPRAA